MTGDQIQVEASILGTGEAYLFTVILGVIALLVTLVMPNSKPTPKREGGQAAPSKPAENQQGKSSS